MTFIPLPDWSCNVVDIPEHGLQRQRKASPEALTQLVEALGLVSLAEVKCAYRIDPLAGSGYRLSGQVVAHGEQACVVSLDPVPANLDEPFDVEFWPGLPASDGGEDKSILDERDVEPLTDGIIPVGRIVFETISAGLDPYPRKEGAEFSWTGDTAAETEKASPFAALAKLKNKP